MIEIERCPRCNANLAMVGRSHRCVPMPGWAGGVPKSSDGGGESRPALVTQATSRPLVSVTPKSSTVGAGVAPGPSEAKPKRAPRGTFDRKTYMRTYMRNWRAEAKRRQAEKQSK